MRSTEVSPSRIAYLVAAAMLFRSSFAMIWRRCVSTVGRARPSRRAMSFDEQLVEQLEDLALARRERLLGDGLRERPTSRRWQRR